MSADEVHAPPLTSDPADDPSARILAELAEALADILYIIQLTPELRFEFVSTSVEQLVGYTAEEHYADPGVAQLVTSERDLAEFVAWVAGLDDGPFDFVRPWIARDGRSVWVEHRCRKHTRADGAVILFGAARDVTPRVEAEQALARSQEMYRLLAENASDVVWRTNLDAVVEWVSPSVESVLGWTPEQMCGTRIIDHVFPEDVDRVRAATTLANEGGRVSFEARYLCRDGSYRWLEITARPLLDESGAVIGKVGSCRDVHSEVEAWHALERSEQRFRLAMASAPTGMAVLGLDSQFIEVNAELCRMVGHHQDWLLTHPLTDLVHPADEDMCQRMRDDVLSGREDAQTCEVRLLHRDRSIVWAQVSLGVLRDEDGVPLSLVVQVVNVTEAHESREALRFLATHDPLTQLLNRRELLVQMSRMLVQRRRTRARMGVLFCDLDGLKQVNDTYGHAAGDDLIVEAARRITSVVREGDLVARIGGDEFVVVLPEVNDVSDALRVAEKISDAINEPMFVTGVEVPTGVSIGITVAGSTDDASSLLRQADTALYRAKASGRNRIESFDEDLLG